MKQNAKYVSSFVIPVPKSKLAAYRKWAKISAKVWKDHGALEYVECIGDDVSKGDQTSFPQSLKLKSNEVVVIGWATFKSAKDHDRCMTKAMNDPRMPDMDKMPFDGMRMYWGGFKTLVNS